MGWVEGAGLKLSSIFHFSLGISAVDHVNDQIMILGAPRSDYSDN